MSCFFHPERTSVNTCSVCGEWICDECSQELNHQIICKRCAAVKERERASSGGYRYAESEPRRYHEHGACRRPARPINGFFLFVTSLLPGANFMYLGLMKRGLAIMSLFFAAGYLSGLFHSGFFGLIIPIIYVTSFFDAFNIKRRIESGEVVEDSIDDMKSFVSKYRVQITLVLLAVFALGTIGMFFDSITFVSGGSYFRLMNLMERFIPVILIVLGLSVLFSRSKKSSASRKYDAPSYRKDTSDKND